MSTHREITTLEEYDAIDVDECAAGYRDAKIGDPEPGANHSRSYWHGWRMRMNDLRVMPISDAHHRLTRAIANRQRSAA